MAAFQRSQTTSAIPTRNHARRRASLERVNDDGDEMDGSITTIFNKIFRTPEKAIRRAHDDDDDDDEMDGSFSRFFGRKNNGGLMDMSLGGRQRDDMDMSVPAFLPSQRRSDVKEFSPGLSTSNMASKATQDLLKTVSDHTRRRASCTTIPSHIRQRITRSESFGSSSKESSDPSSSHDEEDEEDPITEQNTAANAASPVGMSSSSYRFKITNRASNFFSKMRRNSMEETATITETAPNTPPPPQVAMSKLMAPLEVDSFAISQDPTELITALAQRDAQIESLTKKLEEANRNGGSSRRGSAEKEDPNMSASSMSIFGRRQSNASEPFIPSGWKQPPPPPSEVMQEQLAVAQLEQESTQRLLLEREQQINSLQRGMQRTIADTEKYQRRIEKQNGQIASLKKELKQANEKLQKVVAQNKKNSNNSKQEEESTKASKIRFAQEKRTSETGAKLEEMEKKLKERDQQFARQQAKLMLQSRQLEDLKKKASNAQQEKEELEKRLREIKAKEILHREEEEKKRLRELKVKEILDEEHEEKRLRELKVKELLDEEQDIDIPRTASA